MKRVLITGGNKGIGLEITKLFLNSRQEEYKVIVLARDFDTIDKAIRKRVEEVNYDLVNVKGIPALVKKLGKIDILINNAGVMFKKTYEDYDAETKERSLKINLEAPVDLITHIAPYMKSQKYGRIVNVASIAGHIGHPDIWYGVCKAGLINITKTFSKALGEFGITVNSVAPGQVSTDMLNMIPKERQAKFIENSILKRPARAEEIAKTIFWLATEAPEFINGACIDINNGIFLR